MNGGAWAACRPRDNHITHTTDLIEDIQQRQFVSSIFNACVCSNEMSYSNTCIWMWMFTTKLRLTFTDRVPLLHRYWIPAALLNHLFVSNNLCHNLIDQLNEQLSMCFMEILSICMNNFSCLPFRPVLWAMTDIHWPFMTLICAVAQWLSFTVASLTWSAVRFPAAFLDLICLFTLE